MDYTDDYLLAILKSVRTVALVGASIKPARASYRVTKFLLEKGYTVYPVNPAYAGQSMFGRTILADLSDIPEAIDMVDVFRRSEDAGESIDDAIAVRAKVVWLQLDVIDRAGAQRAEKAGLKVVMNRCPAIEYPRLIGNAPIA
ncbi:MAG: CoA-binding protein [Rhodospirillales bacterium]